MLAMVFDELATSGEEMAEQTVAVKAMSKLWNEYGKSMRIMMEINIDSLINIDNI